MHGSVREELENLLAARPSAGGANVSRHISHCQGCAHELDVMRGQAQMLKALQPRVAVEPSGGFYARVMQRIEASARHSIWWVFVYSPVGKRLAYASLALSLALGSYVLAAESSDGHLGARSVALKPAEPKGHYDVLVTGSADEQRSAVLANFVSHPDVGQRPDLQISVQ
jgi:hypothetical protein